jgi:hypothetical protein
LTCQNQIIRRKILRGKHYSQDIASFYYDFTVFGRNLAENIKILLTEKAELTTNLERLTFKKNHKTYWRKKWELVKRLCLVLQRHSALHQVQR